MESKSATTATSTNKTFVHLTFENGELHTENAVSLEMFKLNKILTLFLLQYAITIDNDEWSYDGIKNKIP